MFFRRYNTSHTYYWWNVIFKIYSLFIRKIQTPVEEAIEFLVYVEINVKSPKILRVNSLFVCASNVIEMLGVTFYDYFVPFFFIIHCALNDVVSMDHRWMNQCHPQHQHNAIEVINGDFSGVTTLVTQTVKNVPFQWS